MRPEAKSRSRNHAKTNHPKRNKRELKVPDRDKVSLHRSRRLSEGSQPAVQNGIESIPALHAARCKCSTTAWASSALCQSTEVLECRFRSCQIIREGLRGKDPRIDSRLLRR